MTKSPESLWRGDARKAIWISFSVLVILGSLNFASQGLTFPLYPIIEKEFGLTHAQMGIVDSSFIFLMLVFLPIWGYLADRFPRKKLLIGGCALWSTIIFAIIFTRTYPQLFCLRVMSGVGVSCFIPLSFSLMADFFPRGERGKAAAWLYVLPSIGAAMGLLMAAIYGPIYGWRFPFGVVGIAGLVAVPIFLLVMKEPERAGGEPEFQKALKSGMVYTYKPKIRDLKVIYKIKANLILLLQSVPGCIPGGIIFAWLITFLVSEEGFPVLWASAFLGVFAFGTLIGSITGGYGGDRLGRKNIRRRVPLCIFGHVAALLTLFYVFTMDLPPLGLKGNLGEIPEFARLLLTNPRLGIPFDLYFLAGLFGGLTGPNWFAVLQDINLPEVRGSVSGFNKIMDSVGMGIGPAFGGALAISLGSLRIALMISVLPWILSIILWTFMYRELPPAENRIKRILSQRAKRAEEKLAK